MQLSARYNIKVMVSTGKKSNPLVRVISSKVSFRGPVFSVVTDYVEEPGNVRARRDVVRHSGSIVILAVDNTGRTPRVLLERQCRYAPGRRMWELPAGRVDPGEDKAGGPSFPSPARDPWVPHSFAQQRVGGLSRRFTALDLLKRRASLVRRFAGLGSALVTRTLYPGQCSRISSWSLRPRF